MTDLKTCPRCGCSMYPEYIMPDRKHWLCPCCGKRVGA